MDEKEQGYLDIIHLQDTIINSLMEFAQRTIECEELPCYKLIKEVAIMKADLIGKESKIDSL